jgi:hypothetical protein
MVMLMRSCKCPSIIKCRTEFGYHNLHNPRVIPLRDHKFVPNSKNKTPKARQLMEKKDCVGCKKTKKFDKFIAIEFRTSTKELEICNLCYKVFEPVFEAVAELLNI